MDRRYGRGVYNQIQDLKFGLGVAAAAAGSFAAQGASTFKYMSDRKNNGKKRKKSFSYGTTKRRTGFNKAWLRRRKPYGRWKKGRGWRVRRHNRKTTVRLHNRVRRLVNTVDQSTGHLTYRWILSGQIAALKEVQKISVTDLNTKTQIETYPLSQLKYFNPASPGTLTTASPTTGTYQKTIRIKSSYMRMELRNNYLTDAHLTVYHCIPRSDTAINATSAWQNGIDDSAGGGVASTVQLDQFPTDYKTAKDLWTFKRLYSGCIKGGMTKSFNVQAGSFNYDPSTADVQTDAYQKKFKSSSLMFVLRGGMAHDSITGTVNCGPASLDYTLKYVWNVEWNAGINLKYNYNNDQRGTFTNAAYMTQRPRALNQEGTNT